MFISYDATCVQKSVSGNSCLERVAYIEGIVDQVLGDPGEHVDAREGKVHMVAHVRLSTLVRVHCKLRPRKELTR